MKLGVITALYQDKPFEEMLDHVAEMGLQAVELGAGAYPGNAHCKPEELLKDKNKARDFRKAVEKRGLIISAFACHGNPVHPDTGMAKNSDQVFRNAVLLASELEVPVLTLFSGCPGDSEGSKYPNWVTCAWPPDYEAVLKWQWEEKLIPYWQEAGKFAADHGVKLAFEMHPGFAVYNPASLLRLRKAVGPVIGANYDPSHLLWQGIDPVDSVRALGEAIYHVHAKDTFIDPLNTKINGVLDTTPYGDIKNRSWTFRTVGYGHDQFTWRAFVSTLRLIGYDYVLSIEHEDPMLSVEEGFSRAVSFLKEVILTEQPSAMWWA